jgi:hypothetical protein
VGQRGGTGPGRPREERGRVARGQAPGGRRRREGEEEREKRKERKGRKGRKKRKERKGRKRKIGKEIGKKV